MTQLQVCDPCLSGSATPSPATPNEAPLRLPAAVPVVARRPLRILVVSSEAEQLLPTRQELQDSLDCDVTTAPSAAAVLLHLVEQTKDESGHEFDVMLVDNALPDMSGLELLTQLRVQGCATPVILVAPEGNEAIAIEALRLGACDYIVKSSEYLKFFPQVVAQVVDRARMLRRNAYLEAEHVRFARFAAIGEMAAGIAHEIRNPMTVILGMATVIRDGYGDLTAEELRNCARAIADNCSHLNNILEEVLLNSQASGQREELVLADLLDETLSFMRFDPVFRQRVQVRRDYRAGGPCRATAINSSRFSSTCSATPPRRCKWPTSRAAPSKSPSGKIKWRVK
ncbi:MAG TPA: response regulator [Abditibacteriaceae bacterium]|nr:response regulator [Abditibacteriaceae bacterium]